MRLTRACALQASFLALAACALEAAAASPGTLSAFDANSWNPTLPRGRTRELDFVTDEGTWMSVDASPDGKWIVFDLLAHIYKVPMEGGEAVCLTQDSGVALNYHPRFSPDGRHIAFGSDRRGQENLWVMDAEGRNARPVFLDMQTRIVELAWTPDGRAVIASRRMQDPKGFYQFTTELWRFPLDGSPPQRLFEESKEKNFSGAGEPSNDGRFLYFHAANGGGPVSDRWNLRRLDLASHRIDHVTPIKLPPAEGYGSKTLAEFAPKPSPDGRWLAFARKIPDSTFEWRGHRYGPRTALWLRDLATGRERKLLDPITADATLTASKHKLRQLLPDYNWTRDGREIVLTLDGKLARVRVVDGKVTSIPFRARVHRVISEQTRARVSVASERFPVLNPRWPATSPDGAHLVFTAVGRLWSSKLPHGKPQLLTAGALTPDHPMEATPSWSADSRWIYYVTWADRDGGHIWRMPVRGGSAQRLTQEAGLYLHPTLLEGELWARRWPNALTRTDVDIGTSGWETVRLSATGGPAEVVERHTTAHYPPDARTLKAGARGTAPSPPSPASTNVPVTADTRVPTLASPDGRWTTFRRFRSVYLTETDGLEAAAIDSPAPGGRRISDVGGDYPRWSNEHTLEWFDGRRHARFDVRNGKTLSTDIALSLPRDRARGSIALTGARVVTLDKDRRVIEDGAVLIRDGRIAWVGPTRDLAPGSAAETINIAGTTLVPGWFDMHSHRTGNSLNDAFFQNYPLDALYLMSGITSSYEPGTNQPGAAFAMAELAEAGRRLGPRTFVGGQFLRGWQNRDSADADHEELETFADVERVFRRQVDRGAIQLKSYVLDNRIQKQMLIDLARRSGVSVTHEGQGHEFFLGVAMDGGTGMEHWLQYLPTYSDVVRFLGAARTHYSPQLWFFDYPLGAADEYWMGEWDASRDPKMRRFVPWEFLVTRKPIKRIPLENFGGPMGAETAHDLVQAGAYLVHGGHSLVPPADVHFDMWTYGFAAKPMEVLASASLHAAHMLGLESELGSLEPGKIADLVVLNSDVLEDIRRTWDIRYVMKDGRLFDAQTADELWPRKRRYEMEGAPEGMYVTALRRAHHHCPVFFMDFHGSRGGSASPFCSSSMEMPSGERTKAMCPSRGGRLMVTPPSMRRWQRP
jgi:Tol biopolymer transport system component